MDFYQREINLAGKCSVDCLAELVKIGRNSADNTIAFYNLGFVLSVRKRTANGAGMLKDIKMKGIALMFALYLSNFALPNYSYYCMVDR